MNISYNELPPKTKEKIKEIGNNFCNRKYYGNHSLVKEKYIEIYNHIEALQCSAISHYAANIKIAKNNFKFDEKYDVLDGWIKFITIFDNFDDELKEELFPYLFGENNENRL